MFRELVKLTKSGGTCEGGLAFWPAEIVLAVLLPKVIRGQVMSSIRAAA